jgi:hypothetical protein
MKAKHLILFFMTLGLCIPMQAQYEGLVVKIDYFDPASPKYRQHIEMMYDIFTHGYWLTVSTEKTLFSKGSTKVRDHVTNTSHYYRSKTITDTIINLTKEDFNKLAGECYQIASTIISEKMKTSAYWIIAGPEPTINLSITNGPITTEFLFKCPICPKDNYYEEQFRDILAKILSHGCLDDKIILGKCENEKDKH